MGLVPRPGRVGGSVMLEGQEMLGQPQSVLAQRARRPCSDGVPGADDRTEPGDAGRHGRSPRSWCCIRICLGAEAGRTGGGRTGRGRHRLTQAARGGLPAPASGGMRQRVMIAMALACRPALLIADEPTTALDVTIQAQILDLMQALQDEIGMAMQFISHNLAVISEIAHEIVVMYAGRVVERAPADALFGTPLHPYTLGSDRHTAGSVARRRRGPAGDPGRRGRPGAGVALAVASPTAAAGGCRLPASRAAAGGGRAGHCGRLLQGRAMTPDHWLRSTDPRAVPGRPRGPDRGR